MHTGEISASRRELPAPYYSVLQRTTRLLDLKFHGFRAWLRNEKPEWRPNDFRNYVGPKWPSKTFVKHAAKQSGPSRSLFLETLHADILEIHQARVSSHRTLSMHSFLGNIL